MNQKPSNESPDNRLPLLPLKNSVVFPEVLVPLAAGRPRSVAALEAALDSKSEEILVVAQRDPEVEEPASDDLYQTATLAKIRKAAQQDTGQVEVLVHGEARVQLLSVVEQDGYLQASYAPAEWYEEDTPQAEALFRAVLDLSAQVFSMARSKASSELTQLMGSTQDRTRVVSLLASMLSLGVEKEQAILESRSLGEALGRLYEHLQYEVQVLKLSSEISSQTRSEIDQEQRNYILRRQLRQIQQELGEEDSEAVEVEELREQLEEADLPEQVRSEAERELKRLDRLPAASPEYHTIRTYLSLVLELPWNKTSEGEIDLPKAKEVLDADHYDLETVKERILDQLAVHKLKADARAAILCFVGAPGVGKTSLGKSIARALGRPFERISLGGMHDEAELRGHRRTYIGAMPGRIIQALRRAGAKDTVLMLDEIDKLGRDFRGDPAAALLEILDPAQNHTFHDNYLDLPFDLSRVFFIATANNLGSIPAALLDRLEVIRLEGYTEDDKLQIARRYLLPRQLSEVGLKPEDCDIEDEALRRIVSRYTREAGVRQLERQIGRAVRKIARRFAEGDTQPVLIRAQDLRRLLDTELFFQEEARRKLPAGVATGLAWTESGGDVLFVEAALLPEGRGLTLTGQLGDVMQESAKAAQSYAWANARRFGIDPRVFKDSGLHVHVPAGAIPKDGPSAGVTMVTALVSLYTQIPARSDTGMTGEVTLSGLVLPIGGVKEKVLAAQRAGLKRVVLPEQNKKDIDKLPQAVQDSMELVFVSEVDQLLRESIPDLSRWMNEAASKQPPGPRRSSTSPQAVV